jgi:hypothetical protein
MKIIKTGRSQYGQYMQLEDKTFKGITDPVANYLKDKVPCEVEIVETSGEGKGEKVSKVKILGQKTQEKLGDFQEADKVESVPQSVWAKKDRMIARENVLRTAVEALDTLAKIDPERAKKLIEGEVQLIDVIMDVAGALEDWVYRPMPEEA